MRFLRERLFIFIYFVFLKMVYKTVESLFEGGVVRVVSFIKGFIFEKGKIEQIIFIFIFIFICFL